MIFPSAVHPKISHADSSTLLNLLPSSQVQLSTPHLTYLGLAHTHEKTLNSVTHSPHHQGQNSILPRDGQLLMFLDPLCILLPTSCKASPYEPLLVTIVHCQAFPEALMDPLSQNH